MTINADLPHYNERSPSSPLRHREVHAYYGHLSTVATHEYLSQLGRPFIIGRSTSVGSGHFIGHWTGDNVATWDFLRLSISGNFLFQIFGIQMVGADICGFYQNTNE
jgi:alpha-glucosidase (family GH31 glycosyl hydrolase)